MSARLDATGLSGLLRPRIAVLVLAETAAAFLLERPASLAALPWLLLGTLLVSGAGCALNHWLERDTDALMPRTAVRPLVTGALSPRTVLVGSGLALLAGLALLWWRCNPLTSGLQLLAAVIYLGIYTPLKRRTSTNTWIGAIPGAMPVLAGSAAASGAISRLSLIVFALVFLWQLPHFFAIASMYREQYRQGGLRMLSGDDPHDELLRWQLPMMVMSVMLVSALPVIAGPARAIYGLTALVFGGIFLWAAFRFRTQPDRPGARRVVLASVAYLPLVLGALVMDVACVGRTDQSGGAAGSAPHAASPSASASAAGRPTAASASDGTGLPDHGPVPDFQLISQEGVPFTRVDMAGEVWIVDFIFTSCSGICVPMTRTFVDLQLEQLPAHYLSVSVDPKRDSPAVLAEFRRKWEGDDQRWMLATGTAQAVEALGNDGFHLPVGTGATPVEGMPSLFHSERFALVDRRGRVRGYYDSSDKLELAALRRDVALLAALPAPSGEESVPATSIDAPSPSAESPVLPGH